MRTLLKRLVLPEKTLVQVRVRTTGGERTVSLERQRVFRQSVESKILPGDIGYLRWDTFMELGIHKKVDAELAKLQSCSGLIVDLRDNSGGLMIEAIYMVSMFLDEGLVTTTNERTRGAGYLRTDYALSPTEFVIREQVDQRAPKLSSASRAGNRLGKRPLIILVNGTTASASECFAGALRDHGTALIVGTPTMGKGVGFAPRAMPLDTVLTVVSLKYWNPSGHWPGDGHSAQAPGIGLDELVPPNPGLKIGSNNDNQLERALELMRFLIDPS